MVFAAVVALVLRILLVWENRRLDQKYADRSEGAKNQGAAVAVEDYGPNFRYVL